MTEADVAHVRRVFEEFDLRALRAGALATHVERFYTPDAVVEAAEGFPVPPPISLADEGYIEWFEGTYAPYSDVRWELERVSAEGERVVAVARVGGRTEDDPTWLEVRLAMVYRMRDGRIAHVRVFLTPELAYQAARGA